MLSGWASVSGVGGAGPQGSSSHALGCPRTGLPQQLLFQALLSAWLASLPLSAVQSGADAQGGAPHLLGLVLTAGASVGDRVSHTDPTVLGGLHPPLCSP